MADNDEVTVDKWQPQLPAEPPRRCIQAMLGVGHISFSASGTVNADAGSIKQLERFLVEPLLMQMVVEAPSFIESDEDEESSGSSSSSSESTSSTLTNTILDFGDKTREGQIVTAVALPWFELVRQMQSNPNFIYDIDWRSWEEILAGAYTRAGYEVILTSRSNDKGRDLIAIKHDIVTVRIYDQMKRLKPGGRVTLEQVHSMLGVLNSSQNVSMGVITTTADFAPGVYTNDDVKRLMPYRLDLRPKDKLIAMLSEVSQ